jgi:hypothetical protein
MDPYYLEHLFNCSDKLRIQIGGLSRILLTSRISHDRNRNISLLVAALNHDLQDVEAEISSYAEQAWDHDKMDNTL